MYYADYLSLDQILNSQKPKSAEHGSPAHDETLFIIIHQVYELWFKQIIHELDSALEIFKQKKVDEKSIGIVVSRLERIIEIQKLLLDQLRILETMTPLDFLDFRDHLFPSSGFQSFQFRILENKLGLKDRLTYNGKPYLEALSREHRKIVEKSEKETSLFELIEGWLERTPFLDIEGFDFWKEYQAAVKKMLDRDSQVISKNPNMPEEAKEKQLMSISASAKTFEALFDEDKHKELVKEKGIKLSFKATQAALLINLYRDEPILYMPYKIIKSLVNIDENFTAWRYRHALMALRMLGTKIGTGGSAGHDYLRMTAEKHKVFEDFFNLSTYLIPRAEIPELPPKVCQELNFYFSAAK